MVILVDSNLAVVFPSNSTTRFVHLNRKYLQKVTQSILQLLQNSCYKFSFVGWFNLGHFSFKVFLLTVTCKLALLVNPLYNGHFVYNIHLPHLTMGPARRPSRSSRIASRSSTSSGVRSSKSSMSSACSSKSLFRLLSSSKSSSSSSSISCKKERYWPHPHLKLLVEARDVPVKVTPGVHVVHVPAEGQQAGDEQEKGAKHGDWTWRGNIVYRANVSIELQAPNNMEDPGRTYTGQECSGVREDWRSVIGGDGEQQVAGDRCVLGSKS